MSDSPFLLPQPPRVTTEEARDTARAWKGMADHLRAIRDVAGSRHALQESQWWLVFAQALSANPRTDGQ